MTQRGCPPFTCVWNDRTAGLGVLRKLLRPSSARASGPADVGLDDATLAELVAAADAWSESQSESARTLRASGAVLGRRRLPVTAG